MKRITVPEMKIGMIAHSHDARFDIYSVTDVTANCSRDLKPGEVIFQAKGKWIDGVIEPNYFGPTQDWLFQGNQNASVMIEE